MDIFRLILVKSTYAPVIWSTLNVLGNFRLRIICVSVTILLILLIRILGRIIMDTFGWFTVQNRQCGHWLGLPNLVHKVPLNSAPVDRFDHFKLEIDLNQLNLK